VRSLGIQGAIEVHSRRFHFYYVQAIFATLSFVVYNASETHSAEKEPYGLKEGLSFSEDRFVAEGGIGSQKLPRP
jgi:hypothetical protein